MTILAWIEDRRRLKLQNQQNINPKQIKSATFINNRTNQMKTELKRTKNEEDYTISVRFARTASIS